MLGDAKRLEPCADAHRVHKRCVCEEATAEIDLKVAPRDLIDHEDLPTRTDDSGVRRLLSTAYQARVRFDKHTQPLFIGAQGRAKIDVAPRSLADRLYRYLSRTFHFEL